MRHLSSILSLLLIISCAAHKEEISPSQDTCKKAILDELKHMGSLMVIGKGNVYTFDHSRMKLPIDFHKLTWNTWFGQITDLDSIDTQFMLFYESLKKLKFNECQSKISKSDILNNFVKPTSESPLNRLFYRLNSRSQPSCFDINDLFPYRNCGVITFVFDSSNQIDNIETINFFPYDLPQLKK